MKQVLKQCFCLLRPAASTSLGNYLAASIQRVCPRPPEPGFLERGAVQGILTCIEAWWLKRFLRQYLPVVTASRCMAVNSRVQCTEIVKVTGTMMWEGGRGEREKEVGKAPPPTPAEFQVHLLEIFQAHFSIYSFFGCFWFFLNAASKTVFFSRRKLCILLLPTIGVWGRMFPTSLQLPLPTEIETQGREVCLGWMLSWESHRAGKDGRTGGAGRGGCGDALG